MKIDYDVFDMKVFNELIALALSLFTITIYIIATNSVTAVYSLHLLILFVILGLSFALFQRKNHTAIIFSLVGGVVIWVGITGWFLSPFVYLFTLVAIILSFMYHPIVSASFIAVLTLLFIPNLGSIDQGYDIFTIVSLLIVIPISLVLRKEYLKLKQNEKQILVLEEENKQYRDVVDRVLGNKITKIAVELKEPINDIRQTALYGKRIKEKKESDNLLRKIVELSEKSLSLVKDFEQKSTGKKMVKTKKTS